MQSFALFAFIFSLNAYGEDLTATIDGTNPKASLHENGTWEVLPEPELKVN